MHQKYWLGGLLAVSGALQAAQLGSLTVMSHAGEPLSARLSLTGEVEAGKSLKLSVATEDEYARLKETYTEGLAGIALKQVSASPMVVELTGKSAIRVEKVPLIIVLREDGKTQAKRYEISLAPAPATAQKPKESAKLSAKAPVKESAKPAAASAAAVPSALSAPKSAPVVDKSTASVTNPIATTRRETTASTLTKAQERVQSLQEQSVETMSVEKGITMWSICKRYQERYPGATMDQIVVSFVRANPERFADGRTSSLQVGSTLRVPDRILAEPEEAYALLRLRGNADLRKTPSKADIAKARAALVKAGKIPATKSALPKKEDAGAVKPFRPEVKSTVKPVVPAGQKTAPAAVARPAAPRPVTGTPGVSQVTPIAPDTPRRVTEEKPAATSDAAPAGDGQSAAAQNATASAAAGQPQSMSGLLWAIVAALLAAIAAGILWVLKKNKERAEEDELRERHPVAFKQTKPVTAEQLKGIEEMRVRREAADAAARKGIPGDPLRREPTLAAKSANEQKKPSDSAPRLNLTADAAGAAGPLSEDAPTVPKVQPSAMPRTPASAVNPVPVAGIGGKVSPTLTQKPAVRPDAARTEPTLGSTDVRLGVPRMQSSLASSMKQKLDIARKYLSIGATVQAKTLLAEVIRLGDRADQDAAQKLLESIGQ